MNFWLKRQRIKCNLFGHNFKWGVCQRCVLPQPGYTDKDLKKEQKKSNPTGEYKF